MQSDGGTALRLVIAGAAAALTVAAVVVVGAPALAQPVVAGHAVPVTEKTLADGYQLAVRIPPTASGFEARDAHLFVPPGWLRDPSATRPVVEMMMGQPGSPTLGATLDALHSLGDDRLNQAPFVLVVDQLGALDKNPPCADVPGSKLVTYLAQDVPAWIDANLPACARPLAARDRRVLARRRMRGVPGCDVPAEVRGASSTSPAPTSPASTVRPPRATSTSAADQVAYEKTWPANVLASRDYPQTTVGIFVTGAEDPKFRPQVESTATAAENAGWKVTYWAGPGAGHSSPTLTKGLADRLQPADRRLARRPARRRAGDRFLCVPDQTSRACGLTQAAAVAGTVAIVDLSALAVFLVIALQPVLRPPRGDPARCATPPDALART